MAQLQSKLGRRSRISCVGTLPYIGEGFVSGSVHCETVEEDDGHTGTVGFGGVHQGGTSSSALPTLPAPFRQLSEGGRSLSAYVKATGFGSGQEGNQFGAERQRQFFGDLHAQRQNFAGEPCEGAGADPISSEWARLGPCSEVIHCARGSASAARDGASAAPVAAKLGDAGFGRPIVDSRGGRAAAGVALEGLSARLGERDDTTMAVQRKVVHTKGPGCN